MDPNTSYSKDLAKRKQRQDARDLARREGREGPFTQRKPNLTVHEMQKMTWDEFIDYYDHEEEDKFWLGMK